MTMAVLTWPQPLNNIIPTFMLSGLLLTLGLGMVVDWVWLARHRMDVAGSGTLAALMLTSLCAGPPHAIFLALIIAVGSSHLRASRLNPLKFHLTGGCSRHHRPHPSAWLTFRRL